ncbi:MAG: PIN domain-containing protein [Candidatus Electrothrix sp. EH2]|nr:PIN domain-containing protein [Candidatus Electrothrix sp. EH2]
MEKVYIETSIVSYLTARASNNLIAVARQKETVDWWELKKDLFALYISEVVLEEAGRGDTHAASRRLSVLGGIEILPVNKKVTVLSKALIKDGAIPEKALDDALHVAIASIHSVDYLLTWNCRHINNAAMKSKIRNVINSHGFCCPEFATPSELMEILEND